MNTEAKQISHLTFNETGQRLQVINQIDNVVVTEDRSIYILDLNGNIKKHLSHLCYVSTYNTRDSSSD